jgi:hypothetical protein
MTSVFAPCLNWHPLLSPTSDSDPNVCLPLSNLSQNYPRPTLFPVSWFRAANKMAARSPLSGPCFCIRLD